MYIYIYVHLFEEAVRRVFSLATAAMKHILSIGFLSASVGLKCLFSCYIIERGRSIREQTNLIFPPKKDVIILLPPVQSD